MGRALWCLSDGRERQIRAAHSCSSPVLLVGASQVSGRLYVSESTVPRVLTEAGLHLPGLSPHGPRRRSHEPPHGYSDASPGSAESALIAGAAADSTRARPAWFSVAGDGALSGAGHGGDRQPQARRGERVPRAPGATARRSATCWPCRRPAGGGGWKPFLHHVSKGMAYRGQAISKGQVAATSGHIVCHRTMS
jgi:hypothetical protein